MPWRENTNIKKKEQEKDKFEKKTKTEKPRILERNKH